MIAIETDAVRPLLDQIAKGMTQYACQFHVQIAWPQMVVHGDGHYYTTGKEGVRRRDGVSHRRIPGQQRAAAVAGLGREDRRR